MKIYVETINSYLKTENDSEINFFEKVLINAFRVKLEGLRFIPNYKQYNWNEYKYYLARSGKFQTGFLPLMVKYIQENNFEVELIDKRSDMPIIGSVPEQIGSLKLRSYQMQASVSINNYIGNLFFPRGIIDGATNAGKNLIIAGIYKSVEKPKLLLLLHSLDIYRQAMEYFSALFPADVCGIDSVTIKKTGHINVGNFTIAMVKTLHNKMSNSTDVLNFIKDYFNIVVSDECHHAGSQTYDFLLKNINANVRVMVSGTPLKNSDKVKNLNIIGHSGLKLFTITNQDLINHSVSRNPIINLHLSNVPIENVFRSYAEESFLTIENAQSRLTKIGDIIEKSPDKYFLVFFSKRYHGKLIYEYLINRFPAKSIAMIHGGSINRKDEIDSFSESKTQILVSSLILKEGINLSNIDELILANGGKSKIVVTQLIGRALRAKQGHNTVQVHDFYDIGVYVERHSKQRIAVYKENGFEILPHYNYNKQTYSPIIELNK
jgi:superfamily II DNA or RNA helicase